MKCGDKRGTTTGLHRHHRGGEQPCPECLAANRRQYHNTVRLPTGLVAEVYLNCPIHLQELLERSLSRKMLDKIVSFYDVVHQ